MLAAGRSGAVLASSGRCFVRSGAFAPAHALTIGLDALASGRPTGVVGAARAGSSPCRGIFERHLLA
eukprot:3278380-Heterocapsa_arctica.AAC.1